MMWWNGSWMWVWIVMMPTMVLMWLLIARLLLPWARNGTARTFSPVERLDDRMAAGEIGVDEYRTRRTELEHRS